MSSVLVDVKNRCIAVLTVNNLNKNIFCQHLN